MPYIVWNIYWSYDSYAVLRTPYYGIRRTTLRTPYDVRTAYVYVYPRKQDEEKA